MEENKQKGLNGSAMHEQEPLSNPLQVREKENY